MSPHPVIPLKVKLAPPTVTVARSPPQPKAVRGVNRCVRRSGWTQGATVRDHIPGAFSKEFVRHLPTLSPRVRAFRCRYACGEEEDAHRICCAGSDFLPYRHFCLCCQQDRKAKKVALQKQAENLNILVSPPEEDTEVDANNHTSTPSTMQPPVQPEDFVIVTILTLPPDTDVSLLIVRPQTPVRRRISSASGHNSPTPSSTSSHSLGGSVNIIVDDGRKGRGDGRKRSGSLPDSPRMLAVPSFDIEGVQSTTAHGTPSVRSVSSN
ncbi:hypothetical protein BDK51DRAFT_50331 [Blyttiomyces helicus]|uniref:Uncharacterized protein n=1 Tax=Blyttiomyces helicus TaxID=388810 RepID=A0A4P9VU22_9FUNG|nr:hypothetical protein BDK51DRAFT_50331 [Blyttiomyces helicus]|eukprot:RKO83059.1 hypothetical protein BDK51DRAFT_50331 [Blyttiomyces helicus]